ncbi:hypothetical protein CLV62_12073 [Dysgonomonas alginatilytica]|uniref:Carbohydrate binding protein n=1 Tax=Dysgonomonas alginatilytica TaxID=1605892 RepID=A0A2V3PKZ0_9BACT|nr:hypothetical protein [Dysgonomonas alginatilytica]PXV62384.1 hypothetical protein CLV62_12073 [Dysgonomonas alginatilytica]
MVGIIHPYAVTTQSGISGVYDMSGRKVFSGTDFKFTADNKAVSFRSYLYYSADSTVNQFFFNPMVHRLDGSEPSIIEILQVKTATLIDTSFKVLDDKIALKASQTDFNSLNGRVTTAESKLTVQAGEIASTVSKIEGKNAVYKSYTSAATDRPTVPYAKNDLWVTYEGIIKQSQNTRLSGAFVDADWINTTKYTDDTAANEAKNFAEGRSYQGGKILYRDIDFSTGMNGIAVYNNAANGVTTMQRIAKQADCPTTSAYCVEISNTGAASPYLGGFFWGTTTRANAKFITRIIAKLPLNYSISYHSNVTGTGGYQRWITPTIGTGKYEEYINIVQSGSSGTFSSTNFYALNGTAGTAAAPVKWYLGLATVYDMTQAEIDYKSLADTAQSAANNAQTTANAANTTANTKNQTYYSDTTPLAPTSGFKTGDLWYKISVTDGCYYSYRWNGSTWQQINVYVSQAKQTITDASITNLVTKTGIGSVGTGETLWSKINQTADQIALEVNKIQIGGRNLLLNSNFSNDFTNWSSNGGTRTIESDTIYGKVAKIVATAASQGIYQNPATRRTSGKNYVISGYMKASATMNVTISHEGGTGSKSCAVTTAWQRFETQGVWTSSGSVCFYSGSAGTFYLANLQYEEGTKSSAWSPAPEDIPQIVGSTLTLTDNKITLASKTIELKGTTITKAIQAETAQFGGFTVNGDRFESIAKTDNLPNLFLDGKNGTAFLRGGLLTPFRNGTYRLNSGSGVEFSTYGLQDNNNIVITGDSLSWTIAFVVPFTTAYNGFRATIINEKFESKTPAGNISASAPSGMYFFENGVKKTALTIQKHEGVELIGYGEGAVFYGWIILNRFNTNSYNQSGFGLNVYNIGMVRGGRITKQTTPDPISSITRVSEGRYKLTFQNPFSSVDNYIVFITCESGGTIHGRYANVTTKATSYFEVYTGDDETPNDSDFNFMIVSTLNWT